LQSTLLLEPHTEATVVGGCIAGARVVGNRDRAVVNPCIAGARVVGNRDRAVVSPCIEGDRGGLALLPLQARPLLDPVSMYELSLSCGTFTSIFPSETTLRLN